jgi:hypothetical protein
MNRCDECGLEYLYDPKYHECAHKGRQLAGSDRVGESWVDECMRKQREGIRR